MGGSLPTSAFVGVSLLGFYNFLTEKYSLDCLEEDPLSVPGADQDIHLILAKYDS